MTNLLVLREQLRKFYSKYELYITPFSKFLLALVSVLIINDAIGYMSMLKNIEVVLVFGVNVLFPANEFYCIGCCSGNTGAYLRAVNGVRSSGAGSVFAVVYSVLPLFAA